MITLGTSALLARRDPRHRRAAALLSDERPPFLVPEPVLAELAYLLESRLGSAAIVPFLSDTAAGYWTLASVGPYPGRAIELVWRYADLPLGTVDACVAAVAEERGGGVMSFDRNFLALAGEGRIEVVA